MARRGSNNTAIIILIIFCVACSMSSVFGGAGIYLSLEKRKGDPCEGDDENAEYALDKDLKCRFTECNTGYELDEKGMCALIGRRKPGDICQGRDDNAVYEVGEDLNCDFIQCMAGYSFNDEKRICEVDEAAPGARTYSIRGYNTNTDEDGGGNAIYLDRHHVNCGDDALNQFQLTRPSKNTINYRVHCLEGVNSGSTDWKRTKANEDGGGNAVYLDRHHINCGMKPISKFWLRRPTDNQINYDYKCSNLSHTNECRVLSTPFDDDGGGNAVYLDRQNVKCGKGEAMTEFVLRRNPEGNKIRYEYKCCKMP